MTKTTKTPHYHVYSYYKVDGNVQLCNGRTVRTLDDVNELVKRHVTTWALNVAVEACYKPECIVGDIGG